MKKYMFLVLAAIGLAACTNDDLGGDNGPAHSGEIEESYIAINLSAAGGTRADAVFEDGTAEERKVHHADFFFFDGEGNPFYVTGNPATGPGRVDETNHLHAANIGFTSDTNEGDDISDKTSEAVLLLKTYKGQYPSQIVAVLNWNPDTNAYSLDDLKNALVGLYGSADAANHFIMSNAVYAQGTTEVYATPLSIDNIKSSEADAKTAPVTIYVERVAAKVTLNAQEKYSLDQNVTYVPLGGSTTTTGGVHAKIIGWDLYRDNTRSYLLKNITGTWTTDEIGFNWNDSPWYRSYWATSANAPTNDEIYNSSSAFATGATAYIGENTTGKSTCTKVVIKAQLVTTVDGTDKPLEIALWNNVEYVDEVNESDHARSVRIAVANTLKNTYYAFNGTDTYTSIAPEDLQCVVGGTADAPDGVEGNEVYFKLSTTGESKNWYKLVNGEYQMMSNNLNDDPKGATAMNTALKSVPSAVIYDDGYTFYYVDIRHIAPDTTPDKPGEYGIVRNHSYQITINSIKGYGSPTYSGLSFIEYPQIPEQDTYVSAKINILSWRLVNQEVNIQPGN